MEVALELPVLLQYLHIYIYIHVSGVANTLYSTTVCVFLMIQCISVSEHCSLTLVH